MVQSIRGFFEHRLHNQILSALSSKSIAPTVCELIEEDGFFFVNYARSQNPTRLIPDQTTSGFASRSSLAHLKAICEWTEREAMRAHSDLERFKHGSDGCAAFPVRMGSRHKTLHAARDRAYAEAVERFVWATWWDQHKVKHSQQSVNLNSHILLPVIARFVPIEDVIVVRPFHSQSKSVSVEIYFVLIQGGGVISGGAAGKNSVSDRALSELLRHVIAFSRFRDKGLQPVTLYERRLIHFANDRTLFENRLSTSGEEIVNLPELMYDSEIAHPMDDLVAMYHCLFRNQPFFIGGEVERLCL